MTNLELFEQTLAEARDLAATENPTTEDLDRVAELEATAAEYKAAHAREEKAAEAKRRVDAELASLSEPVATSISFDMRPALDAPARECARDDPSGGFASFGQFAREVWAAGAQEVPATDPLKLYAATGMSQGVGADGGFLVPPTFSTAIWDGMRSEVGNLLAETDQYTVEGESLTIPANAETSRATGSRYGGIRAYWISEAAQITSSKPTFRQMKLEPHELAVLVYVTDKMLRNSTTAMEQYLTRAGSQEINFLTSDSIINGTGAGQPLGILNAGCVVSVAKETGQAAATIKKENVDKMWARLHARSWPNAKWYINQDCLPQLQALSAVVGVGGMPVFLPPGGMSAAPYGTLYGREVMPIEYCATLGTVGDIILADLGMYASGTNGGIGQATSIHLKFDYMETAFRFNWAVDGQPWLASAITPYKGTANTQSPFVTLATRS